MVHSTPSVLRFEENKIKNVAAPNGNKRASTSGMMAGSNADEQVATLAAWDAAFHLECYITTFTFKILFCITDQTLSDGRSETN